MKIFEREVVWDIPRLSPSRQFTVVVDGGPPATHLGVSQILPNGHSFTNSQGLTVAGRLVKGCSSHLLQESSIRKLLSEDSWSAWLKLSLICKGLSILLPDTPFSHLVQGSDMQCVLYKESTLMFLPSSFIDISPSGSCPSNPTLATLNSPQLTLVCFEIRPLDPETIFVSRIRHFFRN